MVELVVVDSGRSGTKIITDGARDCFPSKLGEYRDLHLERKMERTDMIVEYAGQKYYVGNVAEESVSGAQMMLTSKAHMDTKILILAALHRTLRNNASAFLITGEPIRNHTAIEKLRLKQLLLGSHKITVNGEEKHFDIVRVEVAPECATVGWSMRREGYFHVVDPGSRTVNFATMKNGKWVDKLSDTLDYGLETVQGISLSMFSRMTIAELSKRLGTLAPIILIGGKASILADYFRQYTPEVEIHPDALYANAHAFYDLGVHTRAAAKAQ